MVALDYLLAAGESDRANVLAEQGHGPASALGRGW